MNNFEIDKNTDISWCPGCGNFAIRAALVSVLQELALDPLQTVLVSGIGQAAKMPHYVKTNFFNGLHGRALPPATAIKAVNPSLTVIAEGGDGDMYGEGGNHFTHTIRRNPNITLLVHNNMVYGLTKGQASPTSARGYISTLQLEGVINEPFNPIASAIALDSSFVARAFSGDIEKTKQIMKKAILHKGFALVDIIHPCVSFNKVNNLKWYKENTYYLEETHNPQDRVGAFKVATEPGKIALGVIYVSKNKTSFEDNLTLYKTDKTPLINRKYDVNEISTLISSYK